MATTGSGEFQFTTGQNVGLVIFFVTAGLGAVEQAGFGFGLQLGLMTYLVIATVGGVLGGLLVLPSHRLAGAIGGLLAGPGGLLAVYWWISGRDSVWNLELVVAQMIGSVPGVLVGALIHKLAAAPPVEQMEPLQD